MWHTASIQLIAWTAVFSLWAAPLRAQDGAPPAADGTAPADAKKPAPADAKKPTSDATVFKDLMLTREGVPITGEVDPPPPPPDQTLLKLDGTMVIDRRCRIERIAAGWTRVTFLPQAGRPAEQPRWVLPNRLLETVEPLVAESPAPVFRISGETTAYRKQLFLLLRKVIVERGRAEEPKPPTPTAPEPAPGASGPRPAPRVAPSEPAAKPAPDGSAKPKAKGSATSEDILQELLKDRPGKPVIAPVAKPKTELEPVVSVAPSTKEQVLPIARGKLYVNRVVRVLPVGVGAWQEVRFEADNTLQEPPLRILPGRQLSRATILAREGAVKLRITGEATQYRGRRYILLRKVIVVRNMNQF